MLQSGFPGGAKIKNPSANAGDTRDADLIPASERSPGGGKGNLLQYRTLVGSSLWDYKLDTSEHTHTHTCASTIFCMKGSCVKIQEVKQGDLYSGAW